MKDEIILVKNQSQNFERYFSGILYYLNNFNYVSLCGDATRNVMGYDTRTVNIIKSKLNNIFVKTNQNKT